MKTKVFGVLLAAGALFLLVASGYALEENSGSTLVSADGSAGMAVVQAVPLPAPTPGADTAGTTGNYTKIDIRPSYLSFSIKPGGSDDLNVTVWNRDTHAVTVEPVIRNVPYSGPNSLDPSWVTISPQRSEIPPGEKVTFAFHVAAPSDALRGYYYSTVAFTNETYPTAYPSVSPGYVHTASLSLNIASLPVIRISTPYISDQVEAGKEYQYEVTVQNTGSSPIAISPKITSDSYPNYGAEIPMINKSSFSIKSPSQIPAGSNETIKVSVRVPPGASGYYYGYLDLGADDPSLMEGEGRVQFSFTIWTQPSHAFVKQFSMNSTGPIEIELSSGFSGTVVPTSAGTPGSILGKEPSFEATLEGPDGNVGMQEVQEVIRGTVSLGGYQQIYGSPAAESYQELSSQYIVTYTSQGKPGSWTLSVIPKNTQSFDYKITLGEPGETGTGNKTRMIFPEADVPAIPVFTTSGNPDSNQTSVKTG